MLVGLLLCFTGMLRAQTREVVGFVYHRVGDSRYPSTNISPQDFEAHLAFLKKEGYLVLTLSDAVAYLKGNGPYHEHVAVLTIDDGFESFYNNGLPLLRKYGFPATLFINTKTVGGSSYMDWQQLQDCVAKGIEIGNHTDSHAYFMNDAPEQRYSHFEEELKTCQGLIQEHLKVTPQVFAYPYGEFDLKMEQQVKDFGFVAAVAQNSGVMHAADDWFALPRFPMADGYAQPDKFKAKARMKALVISQENPESFVVSHPAKAPTLTIRFKKDNLSLSQLQCFIQGGDCLKNISEKGDEVIVKLQAKAPLHRRRTLYTITVPDTEGHWHWFSHLWILPEKGE